MSYSFIRQSSGSHQAVIRQSSGSHQAVILIYLVLSSIELDCTLYYITVTLRYTEALKLHCFLKKNPLQYIDINLTKCGFELHGFFLEPKTAYLKALLYPRIPSLNTQSCNRKPLCSTFRSKYIHIRECVQP